MLGHSYFSSALRAPLVQLIILSPTTLGIFTGNVASLKWFSMSKSIKILDIILIESDDNLEYDNREFTYFRPELLILAYRWDSEKWLPGIIVRPSSPNGTKPVNIHTFGCIQWECEVFQWKT